MKKIGSKYWKRIIALLLIVCIVISNSNITAADVLAEEEPEKKQYTFVYKIEKTEKEVSDSEVNIVVYEGDKEIEKTGNAYELEINKEYKYKVTSSNPKFSNLDIENNFTTNEDEKITVLIPINKLNIKMEDKKCYKGQSVSMFEIDNWDLDWKWTSDNTEVAAVDSNGNVTTFQEGEATITKTSRIDAGITDCAKVTVTSNKVKCNLIFEVIKDEAASEQLEQNPEHVIIKKDGNVILPDEDGNYSLIPKEQYEIEIQDTGIILEKNVFDVPEYKDDMAQNITIQLGLVKPVFTINEKPLEEVEKMKRDSIITLKCTNYNLLYQKGNWSCTINNNVFDLSVESEWNVESTVGSLDEFQIAYKCKKNDITNYIEKRENIFVFDKYNFVTIYDGEIVNPNPDNLLFTIKDKENNDTPIGQEQIKINGHYTVNVSVMGFNDNVVEVTPEFNQQDIFITLGEIIPPKFQDTEEYCGGKISLKYNSGNGIVQEPYHELWEKWDWECTKEDDPNEKLSVKDSEIDLNNAKPGKYMLTCRYNNVESTPVIVTVKKIRLKIDWESWENQWNPAKEPYSASKFYKVSPNLNIKNSSYIKIVNEEDVEKDKGNYFIDSNDCLVITGELDSANVGIYSKLNNVKIEVQGEKEKYDLSEIENGLNGTLTFKNKKIEIYQLDRTITFNNDFVPLLYRSHELAYKEGIKISPSIDDEEKYFSLLEELCRLMGKADIIDTQFCKFNADNIVYDGKSVYIDNNEIKIILKNGWVIDEDGTPKFKYEYIPENLYLSNIFKVCSITQKNKNNKNVSFSNNSWCISNNDSNEYPITAAFKKGTEYYSEDGYDKITFQKLENVHSWEDLLKMEISKANMGNDQLDIRHLEKEEYYEIIFSKSDGQYATTAAILHILPEEKWDSGYPTLLEVGDGKYPVINLFLDETPPIVNFLDSSLNRENDTDPVIGGEKSIDEIEFTVESKGLDVATIAYRFCKLNSEKEETDIGQISPSTLKKLTLNNNKTYTVKCPDTEGDYALYIRTGDGGGNQKNYISNGFFVDKTAPQVTSKFTEIEGNKKDLTKAINNNEGVYTNKGVHAEFTLIEPHLVTDSVKVTIIAKDRKGQVISSLDSDISEKEENIKKDFSEKRKIKQTAICDFTESANYTVTIKAEDKVGLPIEITYHFTVDKEAPEEGLVSLVRNFHEIQSEDDKKKGKIKLIFKRIQDSWDALLENIAYRLFSQEEIKVTLTGNDKISPVEIYYYTTADKLTEEQLKNVPEKNWVAYSSEDDKKPKISINTQEILYGKIVDKAGNASYFCTEGMITDNIAPEVELSINKTANQNNFYNGTVPFSAYIEEKIPEAGTGSAGLQYVSYRIEKEGSISESKVVYDAGDNPNADKKDCSIRNSVIDGKKFNSNDVTLYVTAVDNAGNKEEIKKDFQIDTVRPEISVTYDSQSETKYYTSARTATITIKERNLNVKDVDISIKSNRGGKASIGKWTHSSNIGKSDNATYTCKVRFSEDDDYEFSVNCIDKAGNKAVRDFKDEFTIDTTKPVIDVSYNKETPSQNTYYNEPVTATITITERNFDAGKVSIQNNEGASGGSGVSSTPGFSSNGDTHTATIQYDKDGIYGLAVTYTDEAGNQADSYSGNNFTIDLTEPEVEITNIVDKSANKDAIQPVIRCTDTNYDGEQVSITITGSNNGEMELKNLGYTVSNITNGQQFVMNFPKTEKLDDVYTLTAKVKDKAGNEKESSIDFSVNRYGSVYTIGTESGEWLKNGECSYIKEGKSIVIIETNVDEITERNISYTTGGMDAAIVDIKELGRCSAEEKEKGIYYKESKVNTKGQWYQSKYEINANNFVKEGKYTIQIDSRDKAGNHTNNVSNKHSGSNLNIEFAIDQTAPSVVVSGATEGAIYNEESHTLLLDVQDNLAMDYIIVYLNGKEYGTYKKEDIEKMENGLIPVTVKQSLSTQKLQVMAKDMAGNILGKDTDGIYDKTFDDFKILVTQNLLVRFLHTTWLMIVVVLAVIFGLCGFIIVKTKKKQN